LYADKRVPHPSTMQIRPTPYVFVFNMSSATLWSLRPRNKVALRRSIVFAPGERLVALAGARLSMWWHGQSRQGKAALMASPRDG